MTTAEPPTGVVAAAIDLGTTRIKGGWLDESGRLVGLRSVSSPPLVGSGAIREADPERYVGAAEALLRQLTEALPASLPVGLTSQRSTFALWNERTGRVRTPLISWQDRRAAGWCSRNAGLEPEVFRRSGLPLSPHYVGPKLAALREWDPRIAAELEAGELVFGNIDGLLLARWVDGAPRRTELTLAARTSMVDLGTSDWSPGLLEAFRVPATALPAIVPSVADPVDLEPGGRLVAVLADQASSALTVLDPARPSAMVNLGTGGFVLVGATDASIRMPGYLTAPILGADTGSHRYAVEGAINGAGPAVDRFGSGPSVLPERDPAPRAFAVPDYAGLGSPYWLPEFEMTLSSRARSLSDADRRRVVLEGLLFRVREILEDLAPDELPERILLSGGLSRDPAVAVGLASLLGRAVERPAERELTLLGVARLAAGHPPFADSGSETVEPGPAGRYLPEKFPEWRQWFAALRRDGGKA